VCLQLAPCLYRELDQFWHVNKVIIVMISIMSYSSRFSLIYWHLVTAWIQWELLLFGTHSFFSCRFIRAVAYRWAIHWLLWLSTDKQEDIIILSNCMYNKMLACASLVHCTPVAKQLECHVGAQWGASYMRISQSNQVQWDGLFLHCL